jgi:hypothetical protein
VIALGVTALGQDESDYQKWMKTVGGTAGSLRKNLEARNGDAAAADAKKLADVFSQVHDFWHKKSVDDAMRFAMDARDGFREVAEQASAGKIDDASVSLKKAMANCAGCHTAHREKGADGSFKLK